MLKKVLWFNAKIFISFFSGVEKSKEGVFISKIEPYSCAYYDSDRELQVGQQIIQVNGKSLVDKDYSEIVDAFREAKDTNIISLIVADLYAQSKTKYSDSCCRVS